MPESTSLTPPRAPAPAPAVRHRRLGVAVMSLGVSLVVVDATIVGVLLPGSSATWA
ncbi:hypothetical protein [Actinomadura madurae]|uniref:hypothetical protein n=1 Tax=Actinomadura madurae TaxID=1993 RepID=UPI0020D24CE4|nr:hypothetical protein [Actinomadura madurae]MCQ0019998.1 hypothetical protein [Actinomadura madurae]